MDEIESFCKAVPKIELHAHINGSISESTMSQLVQLKHTHQPDWKPSIDCTLHFNSTEKRSLKDAFIMFGLIHELVDTEEAAYIITRDVIREFASDNVRYLELRTTPRNVTSSGMTKRSYIHSIVRAIDEANQNTELGIVVRLLLAIDRRTTLQDARDTLQLAEEYFPGGVVIGLDLSGDPAKGDARDFLPIFTEAKQKGLKLALHLAETGDAPEESLALLDLPPDRIGHGTYLHQGVHGHSMVEKVTKAGTPIEICLTSNLVTQTVTSVEESHVKYWLERNHPVVIGTDDKGVFSCTLSGELSLLAHSLALPTQDIYQITYKAIEAIFADEAIKADLRKYWKDWMESRWKFN